MICLGRQDPNDEGLSSRHKRARRRLMEHLPNAAAVERAKALLQAVVEFTASANEHAHILPLGDLPEVEGIVDTIDQFVQLVHNGVAFKDLPSVIITPALKRTE